ncbi:PmbA/TldA family metallopeptidase, partial [Methanothrix sp.]
MRISGTSDSLIELARRLLNLALKQGAEEAEVYGMVGRSVDVDLRREYVEMASESYHSGLGLRAVVDGAVGFSSSSDMSQLEFVAKSAVRSARVRGRDDSWISLPRPERVTEPEGIYDRRLEQITPEECIDIAAGLLAGCQEVRGAEPVSGGVACVSGTGFVLNSQGIELMETSTLMQASMEAIARGEDVATGSEFFNSRRLELSIEPVGRAAG